jgi:predicted dithiol-disulfide oxidoreductase (DUF899 family)
VRRTQEADPPYDDIFRGGSVDLERAGSTIQRQDLRTRDEMAKGEVYYNYRMGEFPSEEAPGVSVFYKDPAGGGFHAYSAYARGLDMPVGAYNYLDVVPKGRDEAALPWTMAWARHHDRYGPGPIEW